MEFIQNHNNTFNILLLTDVYMLSLIPICYGLSTKNLGSDALYGQGTWVGLGHMVSPWDISNEHDPLNVKVLPATQLCQRQLELRLP